MNCVIVIWIYVFYLCELFCISLLYYMYNIISSIFSMLGNHFCFLLVILMFIEIQLFYVSKNSTYLLLCLFIQTLKQFLSSPYCCFLLSPFQKMLCDIYISDIKSDSFYILMTSVYTKIWFKYVSLQTMYLCNLFHPLTNFFSIFLVTFLFINKF